MFHAIENINVIVNKVSLDETSIMQSYKKDCMGIKLFYLQMMLMSFALSQERDKEL